MRFAIVAALVALDLWSKSAAFQYLEGDAAELVRDQHGHDRLPVLGNWFTLMASENPGAAFGRFGEWPRLLVGGRVVAVLVLLIALWRTRRENTLVLWGVVLVLSGAAGNLYDNLFRTPPEGRPFGLVRDFLDVYFSAWDWHFPTFNVADSCITCGAICFLVQGLFAKEEEGEEAQSGGEAEAPAEG
ncbi:MAG: signal peptidase II [Planctomycetota bacterium]